MNTPDLLPHLFRTEFRKIAVVLARRLGLAHMDAAEDIASETFELALTSWPYQGIPLNPVAWLHTVAKNKAINYIERKQLFAGKIAGEIKSDSNTGPEEIDLSEENITDSQLQMLFVLCHPSIPVEAQIGLSLRILCGFGIDEIANAFLTSKDVINKRLFRAREKLRQEKVSVEYPAPAQIGKRLDNVLTTVYLLFSEGYYSESNDMVLREDLCYEAMRLVQLLIDTPVTSQPQVKALYALMYFHASRFASRKDENGELVLYHDQNEGLWDTALIHKGAYYLHQASHGTALSRYHIEAGIAYWQTVKTDTPEKWDSVLQLYNQLLAIAYSPIAALNRTYAYAKVKGKEAAIEQALNLKLEGNPFYFALLGELYTGIDNNEALQYLQQGYELSKTKADRLVLKRKMEQLN